MYATSYRTYLSLQAELANCLTVSAGLLRSTGGSELDLLQTSQPLIIIIMPIFPMTHVVHTELIESLGDLDLLLGVEEGIGKLLTLTQSRLDDLETGNVAQEIGDADVVAVGVAGGGGVGVLTSLNASETFVVWRYVRLYRLLLMLFTLTFTVSTIGLPIGLGVGTGAHIVWWGCVWWGVAGEDLEDKEVN